MDRCAVFVDAGYLFAQGSVALTGSKKPRSELLLDAPTVIDELIALAYAKAPDCRILRVYWYDGAIGGSRPTSDQALVANLDDVKLRLGFINSHGQQKGVDSLIVTDLIELARLKSISDALLLSGDEDVRVGVQIAQNYGVRVHLLGIAPSRASQSQQLLQEADTTSEWDDRTIATFLSVRETIIHIEEVVTVVKSPAPAPQQADAPSTMIEGAVKAFVEKLVETDIKGIEAYWETARGVPPDIDRKLLPICGSAIGRNLLREEIREMRSSFQRAVKERTQISN
ncbi:NYN domain-containing protein [Mesorhizobium sp. MSK_1335]|uniref:NYN domain-containing protein n=1 Tax=Mesorhizobium montanum TaxID=3072323 RepID=A0ABU4ZDK6_9HYPH|nr:NYN domain-containing protein [Mesorhizobium sp. MSK_1335]MDX8523370.1 NYN domain-containing protein [Mesorhizobium sp. MSK_1335]